MRRRFMWRFGCLLFAAILLLGTLVAGASWLIGRILEGSPLIAVSALLAIPAAVVVLALGLRAARRTAAPIGDLIEAAGRLEAGQVGVRVAERGPREVRSLARAFNAMSARIEETDAARRQLLADVSHELRTPLTVMQGTLEAMVDGLYPIDAEQISPVLDEARVLSRLVDDLRTLSLAEARSLRLHPEPTDLARLVAEVVAGHRAAADAAGVTLAVVETADRIIGEVDAARIRQVLGNLVANALRFTPSGGEIEVKLESRGGVAMVTVRDDGDGMDADAVEHAFDRFFRSPTSPGSGLGLAIARNLVEAHGGRIAIRSELGRGTTVELSLPLGQVE